mmetsp:Transcript_18906/g.39167  ORF Transcript_18906/g.39167 Transcript_18906/m.39167 type:complete len:154 (+) Transcript_18906:29-490(+)
MEHFWNSLVLSHRPSTDSKQEILAVPIDRCRLIQDNASTHTIRISVVYRHKTNISRSRFLPPTSLTITGSVCHDHEEGKSHQNQMRNRISRRRNSSGNIGQITLRPCRWSSSKQGCIDPRLQAPKLPTCRSVSKRVDEAPALRVRRHADPAEA